MEKYLASSTFELELYNATSNSNSTQASTKGMYLIAEKSYNYECLLTIIARIRQRLISDQRKKWKRINKTVHLVEFLLKNGSFQFVIVFIDKFLHLVKPYANYSYSQDGTDRGYAVRECSKRILELAEDRQRLKAERAEASTLRDRIQGQGKSGKTSRSSKKRFVIDEEAFYNQKAGAGSENSSLSKKKKTEGEGYDRESREPNLARRLGLDEDADQKSKEEIEKEKNRKKTKEELEKEKEIDEVRKIIENDSHLDKYIKEVDLLGIDVNESSPSQSPKKNEMTKNGENIDLLGMNFDLGVQAAEGHIGGKQVHDIPTNQFGASQSNSVQGTGNPSQNSGTKVTWNGNTETKDSDDFGEFQSADQKELAFTKNYKKEELDLLDLNNMGKKTE